MNIKRQIVLSAPDSTSLLVDFLNEALALAHIRKEVYFEIETKVLNKTNLDVRVVGAAVTEFSRDVKAVTYHEAEVTKNSTHEWQVNLVIDI